MTPILLSVIICTRNRAGEVANCLPHVAEQAKHFQDVQVIVVDNGSTDDTKAVIEEISTATGYPFRYVFEPVPGLCQARNTGRAEASGRVLTYIDDDEEIGPNWLSRIREHFLADKSDCLAGKIGLRLEAEPPFPVDDSILWFFCVTTLGDEPRFIQYPEHPIGGNMSFKTSVFDAVGGFDTKLKLYGDETELFRRAAQKGFSTYYDPSVEVNQVIPKTRLSKSEIRRKSYIRGQGAAAVWLLEQGKRRSRLSKIAEYSARAAYITARSASGKTFGRFFTLWYTYGYLVQLIKGAEVKS